MRLKYEIKVPWESNSAHPDLPLWVNHSYTVIRASMKFLLFFFLLVSQVAPAPQPPDYAFVKKVLSAKDSVSDDTPVVDKKVFIKFVQGPYTFKKRREKGNRVTFSCNGCEKYW